MSLRLESLNVSSLRIPVIPPPPTLSPSSSVVFPALTHLIFFDAPLRLWPDIDALEAWTGGRLRSLRISLTTLPSENSPQANPVSDDPLHISGDATSVRSFLIAKLSSLMSLNSTPVTPAERRDSEVFYISQVTKTLSTHRETKSSNWARYEHLCDIHGQSTHPTHVGKTSALRSKMMSAP